MKFIKEAKTREFFPEAPEQLKKAPVYMVIRGEKTARIKAKITKIGVYRSELIGILSDGRIVKWNHKKRYWVYFAY